jgi:HEAT repeat protein
MKGTLADQLSAALRDGSEPVRAGVAKVLGKRTQEAAASVPL